MSRIDEFLLAVRGELVLQDSHPHDVSLLELMVHMAFSDGVIDEAEWELLERLRPGLEHPDLRAWVMDVAAAPSDFAGLSALLKSASDLAALMAFATEMAMIDGTLHDEERAALSRLKSAVRLA
jgi:uncharacterized membrane protein YebE (DUF533 family)